MYADGSFDKWYKKDSLDQIIRENIVDIYLGKEHARDEQPADVGRFGNSQRTIKDHIEGRTELKRMTVGGEFCRGPKFGVA